MHGDARCHDGFNRAGDGLARWVAVAEARLREGHVGVEREPFRRRVVVRELQTVAAARAARLRRAGVADEEQLRVNVQPPRGERALQAGHPRRADANLRAHRADERVHLVGRQAGGGVNGRGRAASVVAVEAHPGVQVNLRLRPRAEDEASLGAGEEVGHGAGVARVQARHVEAVEVRARAHDGAEFLGPLRLVLEVGRRAGLPHIVAARGAGADARGGGVEAVADEVVADLQADAVLGLAPEERHVPLVGRLEARGHALVHLLELVGRRVGRVVQEVGEVREQVEVVVEGVGHQLRGGGVVAPVPLGNRAVALRVAAGGRVQRAEAADLEAAGDGVVAREGALRDLVGAVPLAAIGEAQHAPPERVVAGAVAEDAVALPEVVALLPGTVLVHEFHAVEQRAVAELGRGREDAARVAEAATLQLPERAGQRAGVSHVRRARRGEVAVRRAVGAFAIINARDQLGDNPVEVRVALAVAVRGEVDGHPVERGGEVGAVVEVEAAEEILVGLTRAAVLRDDDAGDGLQQLTGAEQRARAEVVEAHGALRGRRCEAGEVIRAAPDDDIGQARGWSVGEGGRGVLRESGGDTEEAANDDERTGDGVLRLRFHDYDGSSGNPLAQRRRVRRSFWRKGEARLNETRGIGCPEMRCARNGRAPATVPFQAGWLRRRRAGRDRATAANACAVARPGGAEPAPR